MIVYGNGDETIRPYRLSTWPCGQTMVKRYLTVSIFELWLFRSCSAKQPRRRFCLVFGLAFAFVNKDSPKRIIIIWHKLSSPQVEGSHHLFNPGVKVVSCFAEFRKSFTLIFPLDSQWGSLFESQYRLVSVDMLGSCLFYACLHACFVLMLILDKHCVHDIVELLALEYCYWIDSSLSLDYWVWYSLELHIIHWLFGSDLSIFKLS